MLTVTLNWKMSSESKKDSLRTGTWPSRLLLPLFHLILTLGRELKFHIEGRVITIFYFNNLVMDDMSCESSCDDAVRGCGESHIDEKIACLIGLQIRSPFYQVETGLMALLKNCLELEAGNSTSILSGYVDHFHSIESEDVGWGCGWRNIQMLSSHLLMRRQEAREVLFGGSGFVPDIASLQRWLEIAWERGFDALGSEHFNRKIYGSRNWIGATECAALFRSFGLRARIVDFGPKELESLCLSVPGSSLGAQVSKINDRGKRKVVQVYGPMDKYILGRHYDAPLAGSRGDENSRYSSMQLGSNLGGGSGDNVLNKCARKNKGSEVLVHWVWNYFSDESLSKSCHHRVAVSEKPPLYFQHDGHSRTVVGVQVKHQQNGTQQFSLLILDPAHRTAALKTSLKENDGWQKLIKRGVHTLKKPQYQLCYIDPGIASEGEMELLKRIDSIFLEF
ncbi:uncharacterized protein LOC126714439 isoform X3 [Quercus robur]|uniref:uncharacterized protein LOC126714439 isoform X3 n=2 Tax=Quercus robur TaxID=38942 RepID=UPI00216287F5|nr:uncharacterized protein LOC126714439 isoform X3 [Quercus robur]XP_050270578.1 uncharacterized protein LOC126714439 isoform X3 [Quercus robur]